MAESDADPMRSPQNRSRLWVSPLRSGRRKVDHRPRLPTVPQTYTFYRWRPGTVSDCCVRTYYGPEKERRCYFVRVCVDYPKWLTVVWRPKTFPPSPSALCIVAETPNRYFSLCKHRRCFLQETVVICSQARSARPVSPLPTTQKKVKL